MRGVRSLLACVVLALALPSVSQAFTWGPTVQATGPHQTVFDWSTQRCQSNNIPDSPSHAIRDARNRIQVSVTHFVNYRLIGRSFDSLTLDCSSQPLVSTDSGNPALYDNREWLTSFYTKDGRRIHALMSNEYQGNRFVSFCESGNYFKCLYMSVTAAVSNDYGDHYTQPYFPLVAVIPYQYFKETGPYGYNLPSNIVQHRDGYYYAMFKTEGYLAQKGGVCLMRTRNLGAPSSWRIWNGTSFSVATKNPYNVVPMERAEPFTCAPVGNGNIESMAHSLTYNTYFDKYLLVGSAGLYDPDRGENVYGMYYSLSDDLINWTERELMVEVPLVYTWVCGDEFPWGVPSVIDHDSRSRSFETSDRDFYLYYTLNNRSGCLSGLDRDLVRVPIEFN